MEDSTNKLRNLLLSNEMLNKILALNGLHTDAQNDHWLAQFVASAHLLKDDNPLHATLAKFRRTKLAKLKDVAPGEAVHEILQSISIVPQQALQDITSIEELEQIHKAECPHTACKQNSDTLFVSQEEWKYFMEQLSSCMTTSKLMVGSFIHDE
jgi:hypothetical protein